MSAENWLQLFFLALVDGQEFRANTISGRERDMDRVGFRQYRNGRCVSLYPIIFFNLGVTVQNGRVFAKFLWLCFIFISFYSLSGFVHLLFRHKTSLRVSCRRPSFMPKYRYLVVPLGVKGCSRPKAKCPPTYSLPLPQQDGEKVEGKRTHRSR